MDNKLYEKLKEGGVLACDSNLYRFEGPVYAHDCDHCLFLGHYNGADLYFCPSDMGCPTVISRFSGDPPDYASGLPVAQSSISQFPVATHRELRVAWLIARDCGLVSDPKPEEPADKKILWEAVEKRFSSDDLDGHIHELHGKDASTLNNAGLKAQFEYLYLSAGPDWIEEVLLNEQEW